MQRCFRSCRDERLKTKPCKSTSDAQGRENRFQIEWTPRRTFTQEQLMPSRQYRVPAWWQNHVDRHILRTLLPDPRSIDPLERTAEGLRWKRASHPSPEPFMGAVLYWAVPSAFIVFTLSTKKQDAGFIGLAMALGTIAFVTGCMHGKQTLPTGDLLDVPHEDRDWRWSLEHTVCPLTSLYFTGKELVAWLIWTIQGSQWLPMEQPAPPSDP